MTQFAAAPPRRLLRLGVAGGGQLARMMIPPANRLGVSVSVLDRNGGSPAYLAGAAETVGNWNDPAALVAFGRGLDCVTLDHEFVDADALQALEDSGVPVRPGAATLRIIQDKLVQKQTLSDAGLAVAPFRPVESAEDLQQAGRIFGWPLYLKARRNGYDGHGNLLVRSAAEVSEAWERFGGQPGGVYVEANVPFVRELAVMTVRSLDGQIVCYPVVETVQADHICHEVRFPAPSSDAVQARARELAAAATEAVQTVGALGVELFETESGDVLVNELAPRPHNSGHYTIEACYTSQFENHVRAVLGYPLGSPEPRCDAAVMLNLLADGGGPGQPEGIAAALAIDGVSLHLYGKAEARTGRKMGHLTVVGDELDDVLQRARRAAAAIRFADGARE